MIAKIVAHILSAGHGPKDKPTYPRWFRKFLAGHSDLLGVEFDGEWYIWETKEEMDAKWKRKEDFARQCALEKRSMNLSE